MKVLAFLLILVYIVSPVDILPGIPLDDIILAIGGVSALFKNKDK